LTKGHVSKQVSKSPVGSQGPWLLLRVPDWEFGSDRTPGSWLARLPHIALGEALQGAMGRGREQILSKRRRWIWGQCVRRSRGQTKNPITHPDPADAKTRTWSGSEIIAGW